MNNLFTKLKTELGMSDTGSLNGLDYAFNPIPGDIDVVQVAFKDREELPIYMTQSGSQILCICYLWDEKEVIPSKRADMLEDMLDMNIPMPLSSFGRIGTRYALSGALSIDSSADDIATELTVLSDNALDAIEAMKAYLI